MKIQMRIMLSFLGLIVSFSLMSCGGGNEPTKVLNESDSTVGGAEGSVGSSAPETETPIGPVANLTLEEGDEKVVINWDTLSLATSYDICQADEIITDPVNCSAFEGGILHTDVSPPKTVRNLINNKVYHFTITPYQGNTVGNTTVDLTATPRASAVTVSADVSPEINLEEGRKVLETVLANFASYESDQIRIKAPDIAENGAVVPVTAYFPSEIGSVWIFIDTNPHRIAAKTAFFNTDGSGFISTRLKIASTGNAIAAFVDSKGSIKAAKKEVKITIGALGNNPDTGGSAEDGPYRCKHFYSDPTDVTSCEENLGEILTPDKIKVRARTKDEVGTLKLLMSNSMEPKDYITSVSVFTDGKLHSATSFTPYTSMDPYLSVRYPGATKKLNVKLDATNSRSTETGDFEPK